MRKMNSSEDQPEKNRPLPYRKRQKAQKLRSTTKVFIVSTAGRNIIYINKILLK